MAIKSKKKSAAKKAPRKYDNTARERKSDLNRQKIINSYVDLLVAHAGQDVTLQMRATMTKSSMPTLILFIERTTNAKD